MNQLNVGIIGCGNISSIYLDNLHDVFDNICLVGCADLNEEAAKSQAEKYNIEHIHLDNMYTREDIDIILNLTNPKAHYHVAKRALENGKHTYAEKPLTITLEEGQELIDLANSKGLKIGCAPDTFLGAGIQTCRKLIDDGWIGEPIAATANMMCHGHESWHPNPDFYYQLGGGPLFDMGPYYLTALVTLLGPVSKVYGSAKKSFETRKITSKEQYGKMISVNVDTHISALLNFKNNVTCQLNQSFDVWKHDLPCIEIYGTKGSLSVPDPNCFGGTIRYSHKGTDWTDIPYTHGFEENSRGLGVADLAQSIIDKRSARASIDLAYHVLDIMHGIINSSKKQQVLELKTTCHRPSPLPCGIDQHHLHYL
ncbi:Gfo/Idh/MocA family protein [Vallitalea okinawensis]|uniref:Gfo/Idh/MocA family protein n=1 Tax=Vallitalea okinawensis TaxID=2078660 RepID=UPI000CFD8FA4|nr:Gfo/Idh/MocA family oxidoreductase [Vallitalea okinawensis]